jgi:hypothetical protein
VTLSLEKFPYYPGNFPIRVASEFMHNPRADDDNDGWWAGVFFGKAGKRRTWEASYRYKRLEGDAWFEEFVDSDFGAHRVIAPSGFTGGGYFAGTGIQGHIVKIAYALSDSVSIGATWFYTHLIDEPSQAAAGKDPESAQHRVQLDAIWKF